MLGLDPDKIAKALIAAGLPAADEIVQKVLASLQADVQQLEGFLTTHKIVITFEPKQ